MCEKNSSPSKSLPIWFCNFRIWRLVDWSSSPKDVDKTFLPNLLNIMSFLLPLLLFLLFFTIRVIYFAFHYIYIFLYKNNTSTPQPIFHIVLHGTKLRLLFSIIIHISTNANITHGQPTFPHTSASSINLSLTSKSSTIVNPHDQLPFALNRASITHDHKSS